MAQWMGQFSGHTHVTRVEDAEASLRHAVEVLRLTISSVDRERQTKAVNRLAKRLLTARLKFVRTRIAAATDVQTGVALTKRANEITSLERRYAMMLQGGLDAILREFDA